MTRIIAERSVNTALSWLQVVVLGLVTLGTAVVGSPLWTGFTLVSLGIVLAPAIVTRDASVMPAWTVVALLTVPLVLRALGPFRPVFVYVVLAALALIVAVEIDAYSSAAFTPWFAVVFVVFTTMAVAGLWGVAQFASDASLGTEYLTTGDALMWDLVVATAVGLGAGLVFAGTVLDRTNDESETAATG
ncbi:hypothetical protein [Halorientalis salina]|uniref:hypothetical protein n=1 Tax=Halorientalis salina TaxID=2932266 RepID=UPI0010AD28C7|nr:hypothetical protein [Halorientalis salina]